MNSRIVLIYSCPLIVLIAGLTGYYFRKSRALEALHHRELLVDQIQDGMEHFRAPSTQARQNSQLLMQYLRKSPPDTGKIFAIIDEIAELQKQLQRAVIDTVIRKTEAMTPDEKHSYLNGFELWLSRFQKFSQ